MSSTDMQSLPRLAGWQNRVAWFARLSRMPRKASFALVPMLDMANLAAERAANIRWEYSPDDDAVSSPPSPPTCRFRNS